MTDDSRRRDEVLNRGDAEAEADEQASSETERTEYEGRIDDVGGRETDAADGVVPDDTVITPEDIELDIRNLQSDLARTNDRYLRLAAEFDNYRKRVERERTDLYARAQADLARRLLDIADDLERVADYDERTAAGALLDGIRLVEKKLFQTLQSFGVEAIEAEGAAFDPQTMEGIATTEAEHPEEDDVVADVFQKGYQFKGQLLRPARVRVKKYEA